MADLSIPPIPYALREYLTEYERLRNADCEDTNLLLSLADAIAIEVRGLGFPDLPYDVGLGPSN
ncbi:hypothetical protein BJD46_gp34 [Mycobacterium phage Bactobuster]|uniref:Uncharacterized protein n=1 Tax=Mycobacterium phage Bactobuster TaxID=1784956 RepID=A0A127KQ05_9CAUD|nr:hypothetical protein BJD46_gp34 [Mycobacterium phage Bactobuster]AMO44002.1 hypothetical protein SEA_BACTOBUSTER_34 [Mycobacterium phage Bactobuster]